jgi:hypothetical protein
MKYLRWTHIEDYAIKYRAYIKDESADIVEEIVSKKIYPVIAVEDESIDIIDDESIDPKKRIPVITIEAESFDIIEDESIDPKKIDPVIITEDESTDPEKHQVIFV